MLQALIWLAGAVCGTHAVLRVDLTSGGLLRKEESDVPRSCAADLPASSRKVLFVPSDMSGKQSVSGEYYHFFVVAEAVRANGFTAEFHDKMDQEFLAKAAEAHRIFVFDNVDLNCTYLTDPGVRCKVYVQALFGEYSTSEAYKDRNFCGLSRRQVLASWPDKEQNFIGVWPMYALQYPPQEKKRTKKGLLMGKHRGFFFPDNASAAHQIQSVISALVDDGFELHSTCQDCTFPSTVHNIGHQSPENFAKLMQTFAFVLGVGDPTDSPTPLEGLAQGVAFLNPPKHFTWSNPTYPTHRLERQHRALAHLGLPYVYNIDLMNISSVINAARSSVKHRFLSFVPWMYSREAVEARACSSLLEDVQPCACAHTDGDDDMCDSRPGMTAIDTQQLDLQMLSLR
eukprot:TRINITY_DN13241_c0_g1_i2.p1 TRINITY_DN13241_c0_g1~~TRINITY_DN13241_c0_g1_i2.p1  ORF type:complete len:399 (-),score=48.86 TRINITY_DN13241_c0_g1_i2:116-1312(-)